MALVGLTIQMTQISEDEERTSPPTLVSVAACSMFGLARVAFSVVIQVPEGQVRLRLFVTRAAGRDGMRYAWDFFGPNRGDFVQNPK